MLKSKKKEFSIRSVRNNEPRNIFTPSPRNIFIPQAKNIFSPETRNIFTPDPKTTQISEKWIQIKEQESRNWSWNWESRIQARPKNLIRRTFKQKFGNKEYGIRNPNPLVKNYLNKLKLTHSGKKDKQALLRKLFKNFGLQTSKNY